MTLKTQLTACSSLVLLAIPASAVTLIDDFNDGDDAGWTRYDPIGAALGGSFASRDFPNGDRYQNQAPASPAPQLGPSRVGSYRADVNQTQFINTVDLVDWDDSVSQSFGLVSRASSFGPGTTDGYALLICDVCNYIMIGRITDEVLSAPTSDPDSTGSSVVTVEIDSANDYRLIFSGSGTSLIGQIFDLSDLSKPLATVTATDATYLSGNPGVLVAANLNDPGVTDATFDNFSAAVPEPGSALLLGLSGLVLLRRRRCGAVK